MPYFQPNENLFGSLLPKNEHPVDQNKAISCSSLLLIIVANAVLFDLLYELGIFF
jgi:hypothetical protein